MEFNSEPVGQVRYDRVNETEAEIDFSVASEHRGHGLGSLALDLTKIVACQELNVDSVVGIVMESNGLSCAVFQKAGFLEQGRRIVYGHPCRVFRWSQN